MNFFSSEEHVAEWEKEHPEYKGATITLDQAHKYITFVGRDRLNYDYSYPAGAAEYQSSIGITGEFWAR